MLRLVLAVAVLAGCGTKHEPAGAVGSAGSAEPAPGSGGGPATPGPNAAECTPLPFERTTPVHEASGAAWLSIEGKLELVVISDSGNDGEYAIVDPDAGATLEIGKLPLGGPGEDLEGVAVRGGKLVALTSPGWIRVWERKDKGFALVDGPYPLGLVTLPDKSNNHNTQFPGDGMACNGARTNCGRNYEGLCLAPEPAKTRCVGFAASKADGKLYCLTDQDGKLVADHATAIAIARPGVIADCAFAEDGRLFVGSNLFDGGEVYRVEGWQDPATAKVGKYAELALGFPETLAVRGDVVYRMSDTGGAPSLMAKFRCAPPP